MITEYIEAALKLAKYDIIDNKEPFYGKILQLKGVWATGKTLEKCRDNLKETLEEWLLLSLSKKLPIPKISGIRIEEVKKTNV
jgi:predicted RNase H-like HicB family nuclease